MHHVFHFLLVRDNYNDNDEFVLTTNNEIVSRMNICKNRLGTRNKNKMNSIDIPLIAINDKDILPEINKSITIITTNLFLMLIFPLSSFVNKTKIQ